MKKFVRIPLAAFIVIVVYLLIYWKFFSLMPEFQQNGPASNIISLLVALLTVALLWHPITHISNSLPAFAFAGGIVVGTVGFVIGFFGPLILAPSSNQGPLLGIFLTGPAGFIIGLSTGSYLWKKAKHNKPGKLKI